MSQRSSIARTAAGIRPLAPYEPAPTPPRPPGHRHRANQLTLPLRGEHPPGIPSDPEQRRPCDTDLAQLVTALVEVTAGRRSPDSLRDRVSEPLRQRLRTDAQPWLGHYFIVNRVYSGHQGEHVLHVNATVHERSRRVAFGTSSCLTRLCWGGWQVVEFHLLSLALLRRAPYAA